MSNRIKTRPWHKFLHDATCPQKTEPEAQTQNISAKLTASLSATGGGSMHSTMTRRRDLNPPFRRQVSQQRGCHGWLSSLSRDPNSRCVTMK